jgi:hypothetical protein
MDNEHYREWLEHGPNGATKRSQFQDARDLGYRNWSPEMKRYLQAEDDKLTNQLSEALAKFNQLVMEPAGVQGVSKLNPTSKRLCTVLFEKRFKVGCSFETPCKSGTHRRDSNLALEEVQRPSALSRLGNA